MTLCQALIRKRIFSLDAPSRIYAAKTLRTIQLSLTRSLVCKSTKIGQEWSLNSSRCTSNHSRDPAIDKKTSSSNWDNDADFHSSRPLDSSFDFNQPILIDNDLEKSLRRILWSFRAPIRYAFVYGSGVFPQSNLAASKLKNPPITPHALPIVMNAKESIPKMIDFIFGVTYTQHWHSLNLAQNRHHYSKIGSLGSGAVSLIQDKLGAGVYFNPYVVVDGVLIKYGVVNIDTLCTDLSEWTTLYLAGRLQKPVKVLRDDPLVSSSNQTNLISALRTALLLLPSDFTEHELYTTISNLSYLGDPRMSLPAENPRKVANIVRNNLPNFRRLYLPLIEKLPNISTKNLTCKNLDWIPDPLVNLQLAQDMDPVKRGNMVRRLPKAFRSKLYLQFQKLYKIPQSDYDKIFEASKDEDTTRIRRREGGAFERKIANEPPENLHAMIKNTIKTTVRWPSTSQSLKGVVTAGLAKTRRYIREKMAKHRLGRNLST